MRLSPRETAPAASPPQTPERVGRAILCAVLTALPARSAPPFHADGLPLRCGGAEHHPNEAPHRFQPRHAARQQGVLLTLPAIRLPAECQSAATQAPGKLGSLRNGQVASTPPRWRSPALSRRAAWEGEEKGVSGLDGSARLCRDIAA
jgi:hypothetical protein